MQIMIEEGATGLWYGVGTPPYQGLLVVGHSLDEVIEKLPEHVRALRMAMQDRQSSYLQWRCKSCGKAIDQGEHLQGDGICNSCRQGMSQPVQLPICGNDLNRPKTT